MSPLYPCLTGLLLLLWIPTAKAQDTGYLHKPPLRIPKLAQPITLDGLSNESAWAQAVSLPFMVSEPVWGQAPTERTELLIGYDDRYLYAAGRCYTRDSGSIVARNLVRDGWRGDDWMTLHVDSRFDKQNAFVFSIYPLGSRYDMATSNDAVELGNATFNPTFNMIWDAKTVMNREGWFFEMKIPLYNLRFKANAQGEILMGLSSTRAIQSKQEYHQFPAVPQNAIEPIMKPSLKQPTVFSDLPQPRLFWLTPYALVARNREYRQDAAAFSPVIKPDLQAGFDAKIGVSPYLTLDVSANPDFAQVEADDQLLNFTRFALFFPEKRLFFQEQAGLFEFNLGGSTQLFYSRQIGINQGQLSRVYGGGRLTGKLDRNTDIGFLNMQSARVRLSDSTRGVSENFGVLRLRRKVFNDRSFIGAMLNSRLGTAEQNYAAGVDALLNPKGIHYIYVSGATTADKKAREGAVSGLASSRFHALWETRRTDRLHHRLGYTYSGRDFNPRVGFVDRSNFHQFFGNLAYGHFAKARKGWFQYKQLNLLSFDGYLNALSGQWESAEMSSLLRLRGFKGTGWSAGINWNYEFLSEDLDFGNGVRIAAQRYRFAFARLSYAPPRFRNIRLPIRITEGGFYDGRRFNANLGPVINLGKHWEIQGTYDFIYLRFANRNLYKSLHVARLQINFAWDTHLSTNWVVQYNSSNRQFFNNFRLRYNFRDGHDLYMVWNENFFSERRIAPDLLRPVSGNQAFLVKYSYTFDRL